MALDSLFDNVQLDWKETEPCARKVAVKFPQEAVAGAFDQTSRETAKQAQVPGFRKGKAPLSLIKAKYKDYIVDDVTRLLHQTAFSKVTSDKSADIVAFGRMDAKETPAADKEYTVELDIEVAPEFKLPEYKGLEIKVEDGETLEQHIENRMKYLKDLYADYVTVEEPAQKGDMLKVSYESDFVPEEDAPASLKRAVKSEESWIWLSEPEQIPGVLAALTGAKKDGEYTFKAEFPADWREKGLQGKSVEYKVKVFEAQRRVPVADDAKLAEKLGLGTVEKMNEEIRKTAERELEQMHKEAVKAKIAETIVGMVEEFPLPKGILASASQREFSRIAERLVRSEADIEAFKKDKDKHIEEAKAEAGKYLKKFFILRKIAGNEKISVGEEEVDSQIRNMSSYLGYKEKDVRKMLGENGGYEEIQADILMGKVIDFIASQVKA